MDSWQRCYQSTATAAIYELWSALSVIRGDIQLMIRRRMINGLPPDTHLQARLEEITIAIEHGRLALSMLEPETTTS